MELFKKIDFLEKIKNQTDGKTKVYWIIISVFLGLISSLIFSNKYYLNDSVNDYKNVNLIDIRFTSIDSISNNIKEIVDYFNVQKKYLIEDQLKLYEIKSEIEKIEPILSADKKMVESLFKLQEERQKKNVWIDRTIGFFIGIISSIIASFLIDLNKKGKRFSKKKKTV